MNINLIVENVIITPLTKKLSVDLNGIDITEVVNEIGKHNLLAEIEREYAIEYFGIIEDNSSPF